MLIFSVHNQYFAEMISLDQRKTSYKECPGSMGPLINRDVDEMINAILPDRYHRFCGNPINTPNVDTVDCWSNVRPVYKQPAKWPMTISITNDPVTNKIVYTWTDDVDEPNKVISEYSNSFNPDAGINVFISGDSPYDKFDLFSIDLAYEYLIDSTSSPTLFPSHDPSTNPTESPTDRPSMYPSKSPTHRPSVQPSMYPSVYPSMYPTLEPTIDLLDEEEELQLFESTASLFDTSDMYASNASDIDILIKKANEDSDPINWFHAFLIVVSVFVIFAAWTCIFC